MKNNFDEYIERRGTDCEKWDGLKEFFGRDDILAFWVADMDFKSPAPVLEAVCEKVNHGVLGYPKVSESLLDSVQSWQKRRHDFCFDKDAIAWAPCVMTGIAFAIMATTKANDGIIIQTPVYPPFYRAIRDAGREIVKNPLKRENGRYVMDLEGLERLITPTCRTLLLCSPHNPVSRVWTKQELEALADVAKRRDLIIISDEIHQDIVYSGSKHVCIASLPDMDKRVMSFSAPSKTFNIAGLKAAFAVIQNKDLLEKYKKATDRFHFEAPNILAMTAMEAAYTKGDPWLCDLLEYLGENKKMTEDLISTRMPKAKMDTPEGTYVFWIDFRGYGFNSETLHDFLVNKARVALNKGTSFGVEGDGFARLNIGTQRAQLKEGLNRIADALLEFTEL